MYAQLEDWLSRECNGRIEEHATGGATVLCNGVMQWCCATGSCSPCKKRHVNDVMGCFEGRLAVLAFIAASGLLSGGRCVDSMVGRGFGIAMWWVGAGFMLLMSGTC